MITRDDLGTWVLDALKQYGGRAKLLDVSKHIWAAHESELRDSGDLFFKWQYEVRWAAQRLRNQGRRKPLHNDRSGLWEIA